MNRSLWLSTAAAVFGLLLAQAAQAQLESSTVRGTVVDEKGQPVSEVKIELEYKGESRQKIVKSASTDKKGAYLRVGLKPGPWQLVFSKEGYKPYKFETSFSGGGISELPPVKLGSAPAAAAAGGGAPEAGPALPASVTGADGEKQAERAKQLGESYNKAVDALRGGRLPEAETLLKSVLTEFPDLAAAHHNLAYVYAQQGDVASAETEYRRAIELEPRSRESYIALGTMLVRQKHSDEGLKVLQDAAPSFETDAAFQFALATMAFDLGRTAEAEAALKRVAELDPANVEVQFYLGSLAVGRGDVPAALEYLQKYVASAPAAAPNVATAKGLLAALKKK